MAASPQSGEQVCRSRPGGFQALSALLLRPFKAEGAKQYEPLAFTEQEGSDGKNGSDDFRQTQTTGRKRLLLLMTPATYRAGAYIDAAQNLDVEIIRGLDLPKALADEWGVQLAVDFADIATSIATLKAAHARQPFDAIVPVDDSATILAARANAALGLPWNPPEAAEAARDKGIMRRLMSAGARPRRFFAAFPSDDPHKIARQVSTPVWSSRCASPAVAA